MSAADEAGQLIVVQGLPTQGLLTRLLQPGA
jgi:hypothetical protein